jgi:hypothetical protein
MPVLKRYLYGILLKSNNLGTKPFGFIFENYNCNAAGIDLICSGSFF